MTGSVASLLLVLGLAAYAAFFLWRVHAEQGWVGVSELKRAILGMTGAMRLLEIALGERLLPVLRRATDRMARLARHVAAYEQMRMYPDGWVVVGGENGPPFQNGWSNAWVDPDGTVHYYGGADDDA